MKKDYEIRLATQVRGKWWRVDYVNKEGRMEFETVEALDVQEAISLTNTILRRKYHAREKKVRK
ncbi:hypothetical protein ICV32_07730 [Polynucleobacter sp. MWH-UH24A]|jgi:hypothetical protein|uniref:hypothetical protein n=1 Tax=Polynucleobacter sp. MWH-UH24A TaxID=2689110 RepID=UPI001BFEDE94|nr:hypothetical protein [Polynucleobacter sp. MWH-UH24A]QWD75712.1 hypothetical protein ICV32_07730 [Polynucleobacter sp. MWH-UH24A]